MNEHSKTSSFSTATTVALTGLLVIAVVFLGTQTASAGVCSTDTSTLCVADGECPIGQTCMPGVCSGTPFEACDFVAPCASGFCELAPVENGCMEDVAGFDLVCTASDVKVARAFNPQITDGFCIDTATNVETTTPCTDDDHCTAGQFCGFGCVSPSDTVTLSFDVEVLLEAQDRHDIGIYFALDSGDALSGECRISGLPYQGSFSGIDALCTGDEDPFQCCTAPGAGTCDGNYVDLDGMVSGTCASRPSLQCDPGDPPPLVADVCAGSCDTTGPDAGTCDNARSVACTVDSECDFGLCELGAFQDTCGDISDQVDDPTNPIFDTISNITLACDDSDGDGFLDVAVCTSWRQPGANELCTSPLDAFPGAPSKCKCEPAFQIPVFVPKSLEVRKVAIPVRRCSGSDTACVADEDCPGTETCDFGLRDAGNFDLFIDPPDDQFPVSDCVKRCNDVDADACVDDTNCSGGATCEPSANCTSGPQDVSDGFCSVTTETPCTTNGDCPDLEVCDPTDRTVGETFNEADTFSFLYTSGIECRDDGGAGVDVASCGPCTDVPVAIPQAETDIVCVVTNYTVAPQAGSPRLTLVKEVVNDDGGTAVESEWNLTATGPTTITGAGPTVSDVVAAGDYTLSESDGPDGYTAGDWSCVDAAMEPVPVVSDVIELANGDDVTCTIVNDDDPPTLKLVKTVINDNGGTAVADAWTLSATAAAPDDGRNFSNAGGSGVFETVFAGAGYDLAETVVVGYTASAWICDAEGTLAGSTVTLAVGDAVTCTIVNDDDAAHLTLVKTVINDDGGDAVATDWLLAAAGPTPISGQGGADSDVSAGIYTLSESGGPAGYTASVWSCVGGSQAGAQITLTNGESATCSITNDDEAPMLTLVKTVINDDGGDLTQADFPSFVDGSAQVWDVATAVTANVQHTASETPQTGYTASVWGGDCAADGTITLLPGDNKTCSITNDDIAPRIKIIKVLQPVGDDGRFDLTITPDGGTTSTIETVSGCDDDPMTTDCETEFVPVTAWVEQTVGENGATGFGGTTNLNDYVITVGGDCATDGTVTLGLAQDATCIITNVRKGMVTLEKLTNGASNETMVWNFTLTGPGVSESDSSPPTMVDFGGVKLIPGETYTLCETGIPMGWTLEWQGDPNYCPDSGVAPDGTPCTPGELLRDGIPDSIIPILGDATTDDPDSALGYSNIFDPNYVPFPGSYVNDTRCVNFFVEPGETEAFQIDNQFPGGEPRTIGYWKNWNTCTGGGQTATAAANGGPDAGWYILDDLLIDPGYTIGILQLGSGDCEIAVDVLDKRDVVRGKKMARDAAYGLAAQLLAAMLNLSGGAETCQGVVDAVNEGQALLEGIDFNGSRSYLRPKGNTANLYNEANGLAYTLDTYNNGNLCTP